MYEHKVKTWKLSEILDEMYADWYRLAHFDKETQYSIWDREIKRTNNTSIWDKNEEWIEFRDKYKLIKNSWLSANSLIVKYNKICKEWLHSKVMANLEDYTTYLEVKKKKDYALMAQTYINQERYNDEWEIIEDMSRKYINEIYKEKKLSADEISNMNTEIQAYEVKHNREVTDWVVRNIIKARLNK